MRLRWLIISNEVFKKSVWPYKPRRFFMSIDRLNYLSKI
ncbi:hypothetical protein AOT82_2124 [Psychrobacter sp. AntiMn-1]|nr:hypothetical protein AOT82_2124 [Psychrobacter sp. AntiMn-1]